MNYFPDTLGEQLSANLSAYRFAEVAPYFGSIAVPLGLCTLLQSLPLGVATRFLHEFAQDVDAPSRPELGKEAGVDGLVLASAYSRYRMNLPSLQARYVRARACPPVCFLPTTGRKAFPSLITDN